MDAVLNPCWSKPSTLLLASEIPANEKAFAFALAEAVEFSANLIIFHAFDALVGASPGTSGIRYYDHASAARAKRHLLEPFAERAMKVGVRCKIVVRPGLPADQILAFLRKQKIDRIIMGAHSPGPVGKLLVGSVAETVLRTANVPVNIVGPDVREGTYRNFEVRNVLCSVNAQGFNHLVVCFASELAANYNANLILQHVIPPQESTEVLAGRSISQIEAEMLAMVPAELQGKINVHTNVAIGDPVEELLYQGRNHHANVIVLGAPGASHFAAVTHAGTVYRVVAHAHCPVLTLSPIVLGESGARVEKPRPAEVNYLSGVF
jgi:nucleotide-binding universal stress UspA family protein